MLMTVKRVCNEGSEACGSICNLTLINLDRVKQAVIKQQCQEISEARQRRKQYRAGVRAGSNTIGISRSNITRAGSRESTEVNSPGVIHGKITEYRNNAQNLSRAKQDFAKSV